MQQGHREFAALASFLETADELGFPVAGDCLTFRSPSGWLDVLKPSIEHAEWPPDMALETLALAQHHGVPTRLLDFTYNVRTALWFAASGAARWLSSPKRSDRPRRGARLAVWAVDLRFVYKVWPPDNPMVRVINVPRATNTFLHAQEGFFLYDTGANGVWAGAGTRTLDAALLDGAAARGVTTPVLYKLTAPVRSATGLLSVLDDEGFHLARLMPSYENVVRYMESWRT